MGKKTKGGRKGGAPAPAAPTIENVRVTAKEAGTALMVVARRLGEAKILTEEGARILEQEGRRITSRQGRHDWSLLLDPSQPVSFEWCTDRHGEPFRPWLSAAVNVDQEIKGRPPFSALDVAIQFDKLDEEPIARWHVDLANEQNGVFQSGPLFHLQFGGHQQGFRQLDHPLKAPRWCHPPMEAALVCEVIAANFYEDAWLKMRDDESWCVAIAQFQRLCYAAYFAKMAECMTKPRNTMLNEVWASDWVRSAATASA